MSQRYLTELIKSSTPERRDTGRVSLRGYVNALKAEVKCKVTSHLHEFLAGVFSSEGTDRFFKTFMLRFVSDSSSDDSTGRLIPAYALATVHSSRR